MHQFVVLFTLCFLFQLQDIKTQDQEYIFELDQVSIQSQLQNAPLLGSDNYAKKIIPVELPAPDGQWYTYQIVEAPMMEKELRDKYPTIKSYIIQCLENSAMSGTLSKGIYGDLQATILAPEGVNHVEIVDKKQGTYRSFYSDGDILHNENDVFRIDEKYTHMHQEGKEKHTHNDAMKRMTPYSIGSQLRTFRMHVITDGEYSVAVDGPSPTEGGVISAINTALTGMNAFYIRGLAMSLTLTSNTTVASGSIHLDPTTDPFTDGSGSNLIHESAWQHEVLDANGGAGATVPYATYDVGHLFSGRGAGGAAYLGVVCLDFEFPLSAGGGIPSGAMGVYKGGGGSGIMNGGGFSGPQGAGWIGLLAHEFTHQFKADHSWTGDEGFCSASQWSTGGITSYEPGSGSTIVAYSGLCGNQNIPNAGNTGYYHTANIKEVNDYIAAINCANNTSSGNDIPSVNANPCAGNVNIPKATPFEITGSASDVMNSGLTYCWEQFDLAPAQNAPWNAPGTTTDPLVRSYFPSSSPTRQIPANNILLNNQYNTTGMTAAQIEAIWQGELLSDVARNITMRLTVRDNHPIAGGVEYADLELNVTNDGPFLVSSPNGGETVSSVSPNSITWDPAGTNAGAINCQNVNILLSTDGGLTFPTTLVSGTDNDGSESITFPSIMTSNARIKIECATSTCIKFFDISNDEFTIAPIVPVELTDINAKALKNSIIINWSTASEINNDGFAIQRSESLEDSEFTDIAFVNGNGNSTTIHDYQFEDQNVNQNVSYYYRLKQIDFDGKYEYSPIVSARLIMDEKLDLRISPIPAKDRLYVSLTGAEDILYFEIINTQGQQMKNFALDSQNQFSSTIDIQDLNPGIYYVRTMNNDQVSTTKIIIE